ncbi:IclR family transcriptional regulator [Haladaptatus sp. NG-WS-4]
MPNKEKRTIQSAERVFDIIELIYVNDGTSLSAIAEECGIAKSTAHQYIATLLNENFVVKEDGDYHLGLQFLKYGEHARLRHKAYEMAREKVSALAETTDERAQFIVEQSGRGYYVHRETGANAVQTDSGIGKEIVFHATAAGKAILSELPKAVVIDLVGEEPLSEVTDNTITNHDRLFAELEEIRERGFSFNRQESIEGLRAVGVPVRDRNGGIVGALSVSGPTHRMKGEWYNREIPDLLLASANELELNIAYL